MQARKRKTRRRLRIRPIAVAAFISAPAITVVEARIRTSHRRQLDRQLEDKGDGKNKGSPENNGNINSWKDEDWAGRFIGQIPDDSSKSSLAVSNIFSVDCVALNSAFWSCDFLA